MKRIFSNVGGDNHSRKVSRERNGVLLNSDFGLDKYERKGLFFVLLSIRDADFKNSLLRYFL